MVAAKRFVPPNEKTPDDGLDIAGAMRELSKLRKELEAQLRPAYGTPRYGELALYIEAIDISLDALIDKPKKGRL